jgi:hypothetical protein
MMQIVVLPALASLTWSACTIVIPYGVTCAIGQRKASSSTSSTLGLWRRPFDRLGGQVGRDRALLRQLEHRIASGRANGLRGSLEVLEFDQVAAVGLLGEYGKGGQRKSGRQDQGKPAFDHDKFLKASSGRPDCVRREVLPILFFPAPCSWGESPCYMG